MYSHALSPHNYENNQKQPTKSAMEQSVGEWEKVFAKLILCNKDQMQWPPEKTAVWGFILIEQHKTCDFQGEENNNICCVKKKIKAMRPAQCG